MAPPFPPTYILSDPNTVANTFKNFCSIPLAIVKFIFQYYQYLLDTYPYQANSISAGVVSVLADLLRQFVDWRQSRRRDQGRRDQGRRERVKEQNSKEKSRTKNKKDGPESDTTVKANESDIIDNHKSEFIETMVKANKNLSTPTVRKTNSFFINFLDYAELLKQYCIGCCILHPISFHFFRNIDNLADIILKKFTISTASNSVITAILQAVLEQLIFSPLCNTAFVVSNEMMKDCTNVAVGGEEDDYDDHNQSQVKSQLSHKIGSESDNNIPVVDTDMVNNLNDDNVTVNKKDESNLNSKLDAVTVAKDPASNIDSHLPNNKPKRNHNQIQKYKKNQLYHHDPQRALENLKSSIDQVRRSINTPGLGLGTVASPHLQHCSPRPNVSQSDHNLMSRANRQLYQIQNDLDQKFKESESDNQNNIDSTTADINLTGLDSESDDDDAKENQQQIVTVISSNNPVQAQSQTSLNRPIQQVQLGPTSTSEISLVGAGKSVHDKKNMSNGLRSQSHENNYTDTAAAASQSDSEVMKDIDNSQLNLSTLKVNDRTTSTGSEYSVNTQSTPTESDSQNGSNISKKVLPLSESLSQSYSLKISWNLPRLKRFLIHFFRHKFIKICISNLGFWSPVAIVNYRFIPAQSRLFFSRGMSILWMAILIMKTSIKDHAKKSEGK